MVLQQTPAMCSIDDVDDWGPFIRDAARCEHLSFTLLFEEALMSLLPSICALLSALHRLSVLWKAPLKAQRTWMRTVKLAISSTFAILALTQICLYAVPDTPKTRLSLFSSVLLFLAALAFVPLSALEHTRSIRPSATLEIYYALSLILGIIQCKTLWLVHDLRAVAGVVTAMLVVRFLALLAESQGKRRILLSPYKSIPPEGTGGAFNVLTLSWLLPLLKQGFASTLTLESLFPLQNRMSSKRLLGKVSNLWNDNRPSKGFALFCLLLKQEKVAIIAGGLFRLCLVGLRFAQPFLVQAELSFSSDRQTASSAKGTWLVVGYAGVYLGIVVCQAGFQYHSRKFVLQVRGSLVPLLYRHILRVDAKKASEAVPTSLVGVDMEKVALGLTTIHETWASVIEIGLFIWMIERQLHLAVLASSLASIACLIAGFLISTKAMGNLIAWLEDIQRRIDITESVLGQFKPVALAGFMDAVTSRISALRETEIQTSKGYRAMVVGVLTMAYSSIVIAPVIGFGIFVFVPSIRGSTVFGSEIAFSSLTAFTLFTSAIRSLVQATFELRSALSGFERYAQVLSEQQLIDPRVQIASTPSVPPAWAPGNGVPESHDGDDGVFPLQTFATNRHSQHRLSQKRLSLLSHERTSVVLRQADIGWSGNSSVISTASISIGKRKITAITGGAGSGKTTLLEAFLGQAVVSKGTISTSFTHAAYCSQKPWIFEGTIMENIVNCSILNTSRYNDVMMACGLRQEINRMPLRDMSPVGSGGSRLSGGQRKRVALARAVYSGLDVLILDDVLSGLDPETSKAVWQNLCGTEGLLRREGRTVIFSSIYNAGLTIADDIFDIKSAKILKRPPPRDSMVSVRSSLDLSRVTLETTFVPDVSFGFSEPGRTWDVWDMSDSAARDGETAPRDAEPRTTEGARREKNEKKKKKRGDWQAYSYYMLAIGRRSTLLLVSLTFFMVLGLQLPQIWIALWAKANENHDGLGSATYYGVYVAMGGSALLFLITGGSYFMLRMVPRSARMLHRALLNTTLSASIVWISEQSLGSILNRFSQDLAIVDTDVPISGFNTIFYALACIVQAVVISVSSKYMAAAMAIFLILFYLVQSFYLRTSRQLRVLDIEAKAPLLSHVSSTVAGLKPIQSAGWTTHFETRALAILDNSQRPFYLLYCVQVWLGLILDFLVAVIAITLVSITNSLRGSATAGFLGVALTSIVNFGVNLNELLVSWTQIETALQAVLRIRDYARDTPVEKDIPHDSFNSATQWPAQGKIEFRDVCASYGKNAGLVLDKLSFVIEPGQIIGICGRSGSGKSSLLATLYRFLELESGSILVDGVDIRQVPRRRLRSTLLNVPQDAFLLPGTLRYNLDPSGAKSDTEMIAALEAAKLWEGLYKDGLDTKLDEYTFSSGQRQNLSLARALIREGNIVTVDELTSALDTESAEIMRDTLRNHFRSHTVLMVSHRLDDLLACDRVLVIEDGRFVEFDDTQLLWADEGSKFRRMFT